MKKYAPQVDVLIIACNDSLKRPLVAIKSYPNVIIPKTKQPSQSKDQPVADKIIAAI